MSKTILILVGGGGSEHEISKISADYIKNQLLDFNLIQVEINKDGWIEESTQKPAWLVPNQKIHLNDSETQIDFVIPCLHGTPGETGEIQPLLESFNLKYLGCDSWTSSTLFNKVTTKLWCDQLGIKNTPYIFLSEPTENNTRLALDFFKQQGEVFVKAASQGSSIGCYQIKNESELESAIKKAFSYSDHVLIEKNITARELEVAAYQFKNKWHFTKPGEIINTSKTFYDYDQKYSKSSNTRTDIVAKNISDKVLQDMHGICAKAVAGFKLKHLSRIDFFLEENSQVSLNEINTFPGMTPISLFPSMLEKNGHSFKDFLVDHLT